jgi:hypothetical protein
MSEDAVEVIASVSGAAGSEPVRLILPVVASRDERVDVVDAATVRIAKAKGGLTVRAQGGSGFETVPKERTFNLVPGFECVPLEVRIKPGDEVRVRFEGMRS